VGQGKHKQHMFKRADWAEKNLGLEFLQDQSPGQYYFTFLILNSAQVVNMV